MSSKDKFRSKGSDILKTHPPTPNSIHSFLATGETAADSMHNHPTSITQSRKASLTHNPNCTNTQSSPESGKTAASDADLSPTPPPGALVRLHVQIRQDLAERLLERVFQLKRRSGRPKKAASQRAIIEAALEAYFEQSQNG